jgi:5-methylcytosine-specific restriction endonuclease McrA
MTEFLGKEPTLEDYWRSIILFGKNVACYKFALGKALLEIAPQEKTIVTLDELAEPYSRYVTEHLKLCDTQSQVTNTPYPFLEACRQFRDNQITNEQLIEITAKEGFKVVLNKFHNLSFGELPISFYEKTKGGIILTDDLLKLVQSPQFQNLIQEGEARWRLVARAWQMKVSRQLIQVNYNNDSNLFFTSDRSNRRVNLSSSHDSLNGYQKGECFYCSGNISLDSTSEDFADVDHFLPHVLGQFMTQININGIWNLVLACQSCNRGEGGKFERLAHLKYLERLHTRNEFLINSHHPLRETLIEHTGKSSEKRINFLQIHYQMAQSLLATPASQTWQTEERNAPAF